LPFGQNNLLNELLKVNKNLGVVLVSGNAVAMPWLSKVNLVIQTWYLVSEAGNAIADIISGDVNPSGKLPFSFPEKLEDNAAHYFGESSYPGDNINQYYKEDILVGYRWHDTKKIEPLFAFGEGLSYTSFQIGEVKADKKVYLEKEKIKIVGNILNTGSLDGAEVIQIYIGKANSKVKRAVKELKGFKKVFIKKGSSHAFEISINVSDLAYYDELLSDWKLEIGTYIIYVGNASNNIFKKFEISIE